MQKIGIVGTHGRTSILYILEALFCYSKKNVGVIADNGIRINKNKVYIINHSQDEIIDYMEINNIDFLLVEIHNYNLPMDITFNCVICNSTNNDINIYQGIIKECSILILNGDEEEVLEKCNGLKNKYVITYGLKNKNTLTASSLSLLSDRTSFNICIQRSFQTYINTSIMLQEIPIDTNLLSYQHVYNSLGAITVGLFYNISQENIQEGLKKLSKIPDRLELIKLGSNSVFIDNSRYIVELKSIFETLQQLSFKKCFVGINLDNFIELISSYDLNSILNEFVLNYLNDISIIGTNNNISDKYMDSIIQRIGKEQAEDIKVVFFNSVDEYFKSMVFKDYNYDDILIWVGPGKYIVEYLKK